MASNAAASSSSAADAVLPPVPKATSVLVIGMAGSGKSTFAGALSRHLAADGEPESEQGKAADGEKAEQDGSRDAYIVNLDPAVGALNYEPNVDIRDTVDYKRVMEEYNLGPNGGILTALNLFTTKFDQVLSILERRANEVDQIILDTPGQIEIFTWSASGTIVTDTLASAMPTCVAYVIDTPRTTAPATFMSNMLYACSIMYKTKLPFILVFNKTDIQPHDFALEWMSDFESFQAALQKGNATEQVDVGALGARARNMPTEESGSYMNSLMNSMALVLDEFYNNIRTVGLSSATGDGMSSFLSAVAEARQEYVTEYRPELERMRNMRKAKEESRKKQEVQRLMRDLRVGRSSAGAGASAGDEADGEDQEDDRDTSELAASLAPGGSEDYDGNGQVMDPDPEEYVPQGAAQGQAGQWGNLDRFAPATAAAVSGDGAETRAGGGAWRGPQPQ